ncbi:hypothetical protein HWN40_05865 [Methanolobus zinderi]|uniref:Uncharacterized protein n=1 Tax=Methanolobus zinderi TaxID=536044 RepID=A0A7D5I4K2_9EURY|nr:hypothetical protein [Methanolobus zinderi]QLC49804.1 hypothetical protein HWN40_05865 [Methanolobus zinderi]
MTRNGLLLLLITIGMLVAISSTASADPGNGATVVRNGAIYYDGTLYGTVLTPTLNKIK